MNLLRFFFSSCCCALFFFSRIECYLFIFGILTIIHNLFILMDFLNIVEKETKKWRIFFLVLCYRRFTLHTQSHTQFYSFWPLYQKWEEKKNWLSRENWLLTWRSIHGALQNGDCWNEISTHFFSSWTKSLHIQLALSHSRIAYCSSTFNLSRHFNVAHCGEDTALFNRTVISMLLIRILCEKMGKKLIEIENHRKYKCMFWI